MPISTLDQSYRESFEVCDPIKHLTRSHQGSRIRSTTHHIITKGVKCPLIVQITNRAGVVSQWIENLCCGNT